jgi:hypothetical protein
MHERYALRAVSCKNRARNCLFFYARGEHFMGQQTPPSPAILRCRAAYSMGKHGGSALLVSCWSA